MRTTKGAYRIKLLLRHQQQSAALSGLINFRSPDIPPESLKYSRFSGHGCEPLSASCHDVCDPTGSIPCCGCCEACYDHCGCCIGNGAHLDSSRGRELSAFLMPPWSSMLADHVTTPEEPPIVCFTAPDNLRQPVGTSLDYRNEAGHVHLRRPFRPL
jgi:hypothetical protein